MADTLIRPGRGVYGHQATPFDVCWVKGGPISTRAETKDDLLNPLCQVSADTLLATPRLGGGPVTFRLERDGEEKAKGFVLSSERVRGVRFAAVRPTGLPLPPP